MNTAKENVHHATGWLDDKLVPLLGPAPRGPFEADEREDPNPGPADTLCPICSHAMSRHEQDVDPRTHHLYLRCPDTDVEMETARHDAEPEDEAEPGTQTGPVLS